MTFQIRTVEVETQKCLTIISKTIPVNKAFFGIKLSLMNSDNDEQ